MFFSETFLFRFAFRISFSTDNPLWSTLRLPLAISGAFCSLSPSRPYLHPSTFCSREGGISKAKIEGANQWRTSCRPLTRPSSGSSVDLTLRAPTTPS